MMDRPDGISLELVDGGVFERVTISNITAGQGTGTWYFRVSARNSTGTWSPYSNNGSTTALREECTLVATENKTVQVLKTSQKSAYESPLKVQYDTPKDDEKDRWSYIKFDQRSNGTTTARKTTSAEPLRSNNFRVSSGFSTIGAENTRKAKTIAPPATVTPTAARIQRR